LKSQNLIHGHLGPTAILLSTSGNVKIGAHICLLLAKLESCRESSGQNEDTQDMEGLSLVMSQLLQKNGREYKRSQAAHDFLAKLMKLSPKELVRV
jgi:hypothetical protein